MPSPESPQTPSQFTKIALEAKAMAEQIKADGDGELLSWKISLQKHADLAAYVAKQREK